MTWRTALRRPTFIIPVGIVLLIGAVWLVTAISAAQPKTLDQRTLEVAGQIQCPVCNGESVADSPSLKAAEMRSVIRQQLAEGRSEQQVLDYFSQVYGSDILESPPRQGFTSLIWLMPVLMLVAGVAAVIAFAREWQQQARIAGAVSVEDGADDVALSPDERQALTDLLRREVAADEGLPLSGREDS
ncbi:MAG TPA: cytochrome c-type biogenesis protein [Ktedonobacterales bacterium]|nr:cytochrome c-type biogenesis protein [Ktedonobacterales bacterium]